VHKIKVCQVLNTYQVGGAETVALDVARSLDPSLFESIAVAVIEPRANGEPEMQRRFRDGGVSAHALYHRSFRDPRTLWDMARFFRRHRPHIVHGHNRFADYWACRTAKWAGVPHRIWTRHSVYRDMRPHQLSRYRDLATQTPVILAVSDAVRWNCIATEGLPPDKVRTVVNGIDTLRFRPVTAAERGAKRQELGLEHEDLMLLFVGRLSLPKAPDAFVSLIQVLRERGLPVRGFICGHGELAPDLAGRCTAGTGTTLLGVRPDIPGLLGACDLFVSTSRNEGLPLNIMEAMAAGAPFVAPDLEQIIQLASDVSELASGLYRRPPPSGPVPEQWIADWADLTTARLANADLRRRCGELGRAIIEERFSLHRMVREYEDVYRSLIG
jgi:glycosyltransferase involved in cell wall biosynthesis